MEESFTKEVLELDLKNKKLPVEKCEWVCTGPVTGTKASVSINDGSSVVLLGATNRAVKSTLCEVGWAVTECESGIPGKSWI